MLEIDPANADARRIIGTLSSKMIDYKDVIEKADEEGARRRDMYVLTGGVGVMKDGYGGLHQWFNDDIVSELFKTYNHLVISPLFWSGTEYGAETTIKYFKSFWIVRVIFIALYLLVFGLIVRIAEHIIIEPFYKKLKRLASVLVTKPSA